MARPTLDHIGIAVESLEEGLEFYQALGLELEGVEEVILATNPDVEGEATAFYLQRMAAKHGVAVSRIAHGVPLGGELEFTDQSTIAHAFSSRRAVEP